MLRQSSSVAQVAVQMLGLSMIVRGSGDTGRHWKYDRHCEVAVHGSPKSPG
jgi:hypothetical protein